MPAKVIDCIPYNGDLMALFRMQYLWDVVDEFIITEARETHTGHQKPGLFLDEYAALLAPYKSKLTSLIIDKFPEPPAEVVAQRNISGMRTDPVAWFREKYQRNYAQSYLQQKTEPFVVIVCDADEVPTRDAVQVFRGKYEKLDTRVKLEMSFFYYSTQWIKPEVWYGAYAINDRGLKNASLDDMRVQPKQAYLKNAGWHFSYFMSEDDIERKVRSFAHTEYSGAEFRARDWIDHCRRTGTDLYKRGTTQDCIPYDGRPLPDGIIDFQRKYGILPA
jgi:beta-1,4-mannosyl-glycoprotein beta-1,4-N-acetylglucosaminyltransferase